MDCVSVMMDTKVVIAGMNDQNDYLLLRTLTQSVGRLLIQLFIQSLIDLNFIPSLTWLLYFSQRSCPRGRKLVSIANDTDSAHNIEECSGNGWCNYETGECSCASPFTGHDCSRFKWFSTYLFNDLLTDSITHLIN